MKSSISAKALNSIETPLLALIVAQGSSPSLDATLERAVASGDYTGKKDETLLVYGGGKAQRVLLVGVGKAADITRSAVRRAAAIAARRARSIGTKTFAIGIAKEARGGLGAAELAQVAIEGVAQGSWQFLELKKQPEDPKPELEAVELVVDASDRDEAEAGRRIGDAIAAGYLYTRNLQMQPGNIATPSYLGELARKLGTAYGFKVTVLDKAQIKKEGMGALLAVAQGSAEEPRFIVLEYQSGPGGGPPVVLVGKGVTFDSGGISIKPAANMEDMKFDKSGASAVLGTFEVIGRLKPKINVVGLIPATENLPSGTAAQTGRRREESLRQDHRDHQHRRRRPSDPERRAVVRAPLQAGRGDRRRNTHRRRGHRPRPSCDRHARQRRSTARGSPRCGRARGRALLAAAVVG